MTTRERIFLLPVVLVLWGACDRDSPAAPSGEDTPEPPAERILAEPAHLSIEETPDGILLRWEDLSNREEGYLVGKKTFSDGKLQQFFLPANSTQWTDTTPTPGETQYTVQSYWHTDRSPEAALTYTSYSSPEISPLPATSSWHMVVIGIRVVSDGGEPVLCGLRRTRTDGSDACEYVFGKKCRTGETAYLMAEDLEPGLSYRFVPWAENAAGRISGPEQTAALGAVPDPVTVSWEDVSTDPLPSGVQIRKATTECFGHPVNLWYAAADLSKGNTELRTTMASALTEPGAYIRETLSGEGKVLALVNGGYFASPAVSYSYVCDRGVKRASNVSQLSRTDSYSVTRGFLGVDAGGDVRAGWQAGDKLYSLPLPVYDGGPALSVTSSLPVVEGWIPYSAIGGGPLLVKDGVWCFDYLKSSAGYYLSNHELLQSDIFASGLRAPRTAIGSDGKGRIILLVADGRGSGGSTGLTLDELARVMTGLGCVDVLNLDGGGSSMFLTGSSGILQNHPSDGHERKVLSFVSIMEKTS